jgi:alpha-pyrone synthase
MSNRLRDGDCVVIESIATVNPPFAVSQEDACEYTLRTTGLSDALRKRLPQVYARSGIRTRYTCVEDYTRTPDKFEFFPKLGSLCPSPGTGARNQVYQRESTPLATKAAQECLHRAKVLPQDITHLIVASCTGFFAPGLDILLVKALGLPLSTDRTIIGFMGCYAALSALKIAHAICRSRADFKVLVVCVELCTLHFQMDDSFESVIINALFSDGAAACLMQSACREDAKDKLIYNDSSCLLDTESLDAMSWDIGDTGFMMDLSPKIPEIIAATLPGYIHGLLDKHRLNQKDIDFWAVHPGGRQVLDRTATALGLSEDQMESSYSILRDYGNMSSPTVLFILERIIRQRIPTHRYGLALAFGPGLTIEGCLLEFGQ